MTAQETGELPGERDIHQGVSKIVRIYMTLAEITTGKQLGGATISPLVVAWKRPLFRARSP